MRHRRPGGSGRSGGFGKTSAEIIAFPDERRVRQTPDQARREAWRHIEAKLRAAQGNEQRLAEYTPALSRCLDFLDIIDGWERREETVTVWERRECTA